MWHSWGVWTSLSTHRHTVTGTVKEKKQQPIEHKILTKDKRPIKGELLVIMTLQNNLYLMKV